MSATKPNETANPRVANTPIETNPMQGPGVEWCAERAAVAMRYLAEHYPECAGDPGLHPLQEAAHEAAVSGSPDYYLEVLREYCRTGRAVALERRKRAA